MKTGPSCLTKDLGLPLLWTGVRVTWLHAFSATTPSVHDLAQLNCRWDSRSPCWRSGYNV